MPRGHARRLIGKASEFSASAGAELEAGRYSAAGLAAVHAGITAADALTAHTAGVVNAGSSHSAVVHVLTQSLAGGLPGPAERQLMGLLRMKNDIEYTERTLTEDAARVLVDQATRFVRWAHSLMLTDSG